MTASGALWRNWGRTETVRPSRVERPVGSEATQRAVQAAIRQGARIKAVGSGHSFSGIAVAPGILLDPARVWSRRSGSGGAGSGSAGVGGSGSSTAGTGARGDDAGSGAQPILDLELGRSRVTVPADIPLWRLTRALSEYGLALQNMGDIDRQTLAGAISTGTHGTGGAFRGLATQVVGVRLVTGTGELITVDENTNPELLPAVQVGLGALGVLTEITLQCVPSFVLAAVERPEPLEQVLEQYVARSASDDHFEFYWFPHTDVALTKSNTRLPAETPRAPIGRRARWRDDELLGNRLYGVLCATGAALPAVVPPVNRLAARLVGDRSFSDWSHRVFVTNRAVRFREMEYALPRTSIPDAVREVRALIQTRGWNISFPLEVRSAAADDTWLSTAYGRDTGYIAVHRYYRENPEPYFRAVEEIMKSHDGRPHWGKMHWRTRADAQQLYPRFDDFLAVRDRLDPDRLFTNPYLERVLGG